MYHHCIVPLHYRVHDTMLFCILMCIFLCFHTRWTISRPIPRKNPIFSMIQHFTGIFVMCVFLLCSITHLRRPCMRIYRALHAYDCLCLGIQLHPLHVCEMRCLKFDMSDDLIFCARCISMERRVYKCMRACMRVLCYYSC